MKYYIKTGVFSGVILALFLILVQSTNEKFLSESLFLLMNLILLIAHIVLSNLYGRKIHGSNFTFDKAISEGMKSFFIALLIFTVIPLIYFLIYDAELPFRLHGYQEELLINAGEEQEVINRHREQIKNISGRSLLIKGAITTFVIYSLVGIIFNIISARILRKAK
jgi:hypothetical protein